MYDELIKRLQDFAAGTMRDADAQLAFEAADAIEELQAQLMYSNDAARVIADKVPKWIPVTERMPNENNRYLTVSVEPWFGTTVIDVMRWSGVWMYDGRQTEATVTHWMPLPQPQEENGHDL